LRGPRQPITIPRDAAERRSVVASLLRRKSFWDHLMAMAESCEPQYGGYSYRDRSDLFHLPLAAPDVQRIREAACLVRYTALQTQIRNAPVESADLYVVRG